MHPGQARMWDKWKCTENEGAMTHQINDLTEVNFHAALLEVRIPVGVVDEFR